MEKKKNMKWLLCERLICKSGRFAVCGNIVPGIVEPTGYRQIKLIYHYTIQHVYIMYIIFGKKECHVLLQ